MYRAAVVVQLLSLTNAVPVEWKGIFYTPDPTYKWGAQKVKGKSNTWAYADATMKMAAIPVSGATTQNLANADSAGTTALGLACEEVRHGGTITPQENKCYTLIFDVLQGETIFTVDASNSGSTAFFLQHMPWEFESTKHYFKDTPSGTDIEPVTQDPAPDAGGDGHSHGHGASSGWFEEKKGKCVCQAQANNWKLNCTVTAKINEAVTQLESNAYCKDISPPQSCINDFYVMQAHHDHCLHHQLPTGVEKKLHEYEHFYTDCHVQRQFDTSLPACAGVTCTDQTAMTNAIQTLQAGNCNSTQECQASACSDAIKLVLMAHDTCAETQLPNNLEVALHDFEDVCAAQLCNSAPAVFDAYDQNCLASVSGGFGLRDCIFPITWALPLFMLSQ
jgi:hypothetical protein